MREEREECPATSYDSTAKTDDPTQEHDQTVTVTSFVESAVSNVYENDSSSF